MPYFFLFLRVLAHRRSSPVGSTRGGKSKMKGLPGGEVRSEPHSWIFLCVFCTTLLMVLWLQLWILAITIIWIMILEPRASPGKDRVSDQWVHIPTSLMCRFQQSHEFVDAAGSPAQRCNKSESSMVTSLLSPLIFCRQLLSVDPRCAQTTYGGLSGQIFFWGVKARELE